MDREILHADLNNFFASVELLYHPELRHVPMAVCGDVKSRHGIILAKNELAKQYHVATAEPIWQAQRKCPDLQLVAPHFERYRYYSQKVRNIYLRYTDRVEAFSIDECWLDVTESRHLFAPSATELAYLIKETIKQECGLTVSVGVSYNKIFAKMGSDYKKPDAVTVISRQNYQDILFPLDVSCLLSVGASAQKTLYRLGICTIGQLARYNPKVLTQKLGKWGDVLHRYANGEDNSPVSYYYEKEPVKSIGKGKTFAEDICGESAIRNNLKPLTTYIAARLRRYQFKCGGLSVTIKSPSLSVITRQMTFSAPTCLSQDLLNASLSLITANWDINKPIRMLTVTALHLSDTNSQQLSFLPRDSKKEKQEKIEFLMDDLQTLYGDHAITFGYDPNKE